MNQKARDAFRGKVVDETHTINTGVDEFPRYVVEYVIDNYCSEETFAQDMERVVRRLKETFVYGTEAEDKVLGLDRRDQASKRPLVPADNLREAQTLPAYILDAVKVTPVSSIDQVLAPAFVDG